MKMITIAIAAH